MPPLRWKLLFAAAALLLSYEASRFAIDLAVYHVTVQAFWSGSDPLYGPEGVMPWPMWYRYPPFFLMLFTPFALLPHPAAAFVFTLGKCVALLFLVRAMLRRLPPLQARAQWAVAAALAIPYIWMEFRYANVQFFVFALTAAALLSLPHRPGRAATALGMAIAIKVWPLFFVPLLLLRRQFHAAIGSLVVAAGLTLVPALHLGWEGNLLALEQWWRQESSIAASAGQIWFPSQSLLGVASRYLTAIDYSHMPDHRYPQVHLASLDPDAVRLGWLLVAAAGYAALAAAAARTARREAAGFYGLAWCALPLLQPFTQKQSALVVLLWPAWVAAAHFGAELPRWARWTLLAAAAGSAIQPLIPFSAAQRWFQALGMDALIVLLLGISLLPVLRPAGAR